MSYTHSYKGPEGRTESTEEVKRLEEKRRSLEEKTKLLEEKARAEKLAIDKKLFTQILQEENRMHDAAVKELEEKIADLESQMKPSFAVEKIQTPSTPAQEMAEPSQEVVDKVNEHTSVGVLARELLQEPDQTRGQSEVEAPPETKKKKHGLF